jgi:hypothetical protein
VAGTALTFVLAPQLVTFVPVMKALKSRIERKKKTNNVIFKESS